MKTPLFIISHLGSGCEYFVSILNKNKNINIYKEIFTIEHPNSLEAFYSSRERYNAKLLNGFISLYNKDFQNKCFYKFSKFIYLIREPIYSINEIINKYNYSYKNACNYYELRLRRIYEMAYNTSKNSFLIDYSYLEDKNDLIYLEKFLNLDSILEYTEDTNKVNYENNLKINNDFYEKYLYKLKNIF